MRSERLFRLLGLLDEDLIEEAACVRRRFSYRSAAAAACVAVLCVGSAGWLVSHFPRSAGREQSAAPGNGSAGVHETGAFMSYAGPVFPLTLSEPLSGLTAERTITWDFSPSLQADGTPRQWGAQVTDAYDLTNHTEKELSFTAYYPFASSFLHLHENLPAVHTGGVPAGTSLLAGSYAGGFQGVWQQDPQGEPQLDRSTLNLSSPESWSDYQALLQDGRDLAGALQPSSVPDLPVTLYSFTDYVLPPDAPDAATQAISFTIDQDRTTVLSYGFEGCSMDQDTGWRQFSFFVPTDSRRHEEKFLLVLGEDLSAYTLAGYADGGCDPGQEISGISCAVTRRETTLPAVLDLLCRHFLTHDAGYQFSTGQPASQQVSALYLQAAADWMMQYSLLSETPMDRYASGQLDDLFAEAYSAKRVLYHAVPVTIPAGGTVRVRADLRKEPSHDYGCSGSEQGDVQGYDLATQLGSLLEFTAQRAVLTHTETIQICQQDLGFDPEHGILAVDLDPAAEHGFLNIRPLP